MATTTTMTHKHTNVAATTVPVPHHRNYLLTLTMMKTRQTRANNAPRTMIAIVVKPRSSSFTAMGSSVEFTSMGSFVEEGSVEGSSVKKILDQ